MSLAEARANADLDPAQRVDDLLRELRRLRERVFEMEVRGDPPDEAEHVFSRLIVAVGAVLQEPAF